MFKYWKLPLLTTARNLTRTYCVNVGSGKKPTDPSGTLTEINSVLQGWDEKLKKAGVEDRKFNLKCIASHVLERKFVSTRNYIVILVDNYYFSHPHTHGRTKCRTTLLISRSRRNSWPTLSATVRHVAPVCRCST